MDEVRWIEAEELTDNNNNGENDEPDVGDLFADPDPFDTFDFSFGEIQIHIQGHKMENGQTLHSTGLTLWRASPLLCDYMMSHQDCIGKRTVLELGAGLGLCGILAHHLGAHRVVLTDGDTDTLALLRTNVAANLFFAADKVECRQLRWGRDFVHASQETFQLLLASDVIYVEEIIEPLLDTVVALLSQDGVFWLSYARRNVSIDKVLASAERHGLSWREPSEAAEGVYVFQRI